MHRIAARIDDRFELVAGALSASPEKAKASAADLLLAEDRSYGSYEEMAAAEAGREDGIDAVAIVTPNHAHFGPAKAFLDAGINVICDKPLTTNLADAEALQLAVTNSGMTFGLNHNYTGYPMVRHAREMVGLGELGALRVIQAEYPKTGCPPKKKTATTNRRNGAPIPTVAALRVVSVILAATPITWRGSSPGWNWKKLPLICTHSWMAAPWTITRI